MFRICAVSNASLDTHPNNTLTKFTHSLPTPIQFEAGLKPKVKVLSVGLSIALTEEQERASIEHVQIHLEQLNSTSQVSAASGFSQCLARVPFPQKVEENNSTFWHAFDNPVSIPIDSGEELSELSFLITCQRNKQLGLSPGPATVINLVIESMSSSSMFTLTLDAAHSKHLFPSNSQADFRMKLPVPLDLDREGWEMAMHSISAPKEVYLGLNLVVTVKRAGENHEVHHKLDVGSSPTISSIITKMNYVLKDDYINFQLGSELRLVRRKRSTVEVLRLNKELSTLLRANILEGGLDAFTRVFFSNITHRLLVSGNPPAWAEKVPLPTDLIFVYCDVITDSIVGNVIAPLVEVIPSTELALNSAERGALHALPHLHFHPLSKTSFEEVYCRLTRADGKPIEFATTKDDEHISLTFLFRRNADSK